MPDETGVAVQPANPQTPPPPQEAPPPPSLCFVSVFARDPDMPVQVRWEGYNAYGALLALEQARDAIKRDMLEAQILREKQLLQPADQSAQPVSPAKPNRAQRRRKS